MLSNIANVLIILGVGGYVLPLFGADFRIIVALEAAAPSLRLLVPGVLILCGLAIHVASFISRPVLEDRAEGRRFEIERDSRTQANVASLLKEHGLSVPSQERILESVPSLTPHALEALYPYIAEIMVQEAEWPFKHMKNIEHFARKAKVTPSDVDRLTSAINIIKWRDKSSPK